MRVEETIDALIRKARDGDRSAYDRLRETYVQQLRRSILRRLGEAFADSGEVDDLVDETLERAWRSLRAFRGADAATFWAWLCGVSDRVLQRKNRLRAGGPAGSGERPPVGPEPAPRPETGSVAELVDLLRQSVAGPSQALLVDERFLRLQRALAHLSPEHRRVIFLARVQELHTSDVARRLGCSPERVSMLLYKALMKLKAAFEAMDGPPASARSQNDCRARSQNDSPADWRAKRQTREVRTPSGHAPGGG